MPGQTHGTTCFKNRGRRVVHRLGGSTSWLRYKWFKHMFCATVTEHWRTHVPMCTLIGPTCLSVVALDSLRRHAARSAQAYHFPLCFPPWWRCCQHWHLEPCWCVHIGTCVCQCSVTVAQTMCLNHLYLNQYADPAIFEPLVDHDL